MTETRVIKDNIGRCYICGKPIGYPKSSLELTHLEKGFHDHGATLAKPWDRDIQNIADQLVMGTEFERGVHYIGELADLVMAARARRGTVDEELREALHEMLAIAEQHAYENWGGRTGPNWDKLARARAALTKADAR